jgi:hypothetical protein
MAKLYYHAPLAFHGRDCKGCTADRNLHQKPVPEKAPIIPAGLVPTKLPPASFAMQSASSSLYHPSAAQRKGENVSGAFRGMAQEMQDDVEGRRSRTAKAKNAVEAWETGTEKNSPTAYPTNREILHRRPW